MKVTLTKSLLSGGGIIGTSCAVIIPTSTMEPKTMNNISKISEKGTSQGVQRDKELNYLTFDELLKNLSEAYKSKQNGSSTMAISIPGENELRQISEFSDFESKYLIEKNLWKNCDSLVKGSETYCGYIELKTNDEQKRYKFKITHKKKPFDGDNDEGKVIIVKKENTISYYDGYPANYQDALGLSIDGVEFEKLLSFENQEVDEGIKIRGFSIKKAV